MQVDRSLIVQPGHFVRTAYVDIWDVRLANRERMAVGDVDRAFQRVLQQGAGSQWPCPNGYWDGPPAGPQSEFVIEDGRHEYVASLMIGKTHILVAWIEKAPSA